MAVCPDAGAAVVDSDDDSIGTTTTSWTHCETTTSVSVARHPASCAPVAACSVHDAGNCAEIRHSELGLFVSLLFRNQNITNSKYKFVMFSRGPSVTSRNIISIFF